MTSTSQNQASNSQTTSQSLEVVDRWLERACEALMTTWDPRTGNFWRDSLRAASDDGRKPRDTPAQLQNGKGATSNNRSFQALVAVSFFLSENEDIGAPQLRERINRCVREMVKRYLTLPLKSLRGHGQNQENPFTDAQLLLSLSLALSPVTSRTCGYTLDAATTTALLASLSTLATSVGTALKADGVKVHQDAGPHHFLTLHSVRALDAARRTLEGHGLSVPRAVAVTGRNDFAILLNRIRNEIVQQLGLHLLPAPGFDSSALVSCCALLGRFNGDADSPLLQHAVAALVDDQSDRGVWTTAGLISFSRLRLVYMPSIELSLALASLALLDLHEGDTDIFDRAAPALEASLRLVQSSYSQHNDMAGWRNDRSRSGYEIESWTTGVVLQFLITYREVLRLARQESILRKYKARRKPPAFADFWADLAWLIPAKQRYQTLSGSPLPDERLSELTRLTDPTANNSIVNGVRDEILRPVLSSVSERPVDTVSFLLYGPPGTRKTSFVESMATALDWPLVTLSPPAFLREGIEGFEAAAEGIFEDLMHLKRVVVLFDECEEFFRARPRIDTTAMESRTVGAFITSGMLPRLQRLRNKRWIAFVINTNVEAFELDDAVTRRGRLDKAARVGHPDLNSQIRYLRQWKSRGKTRKKLSPSHLQWFETHLTEIENEMAPIRNHLSKERESLQRTHPDRGERYRAEMSELSTREARDLTKVVTFGTLDNLAARCVGEGHRSRITTSKVLRTNLEQELARFGPDRFDPENVVGRDIEGAD